MTRKLIYAAEALADLDAATLWLTQSGSGLAARRKLTSIWAAIERLAHTPCTPALGPHRGIRELPCPGGYRVLYRVVPDTGRNETAGDVRVLRVFGPGQSRANA